MNKKDEPCREPVHVYVHAEVECLLNKNKRVSPVGYPASTLFVCRRAPSVGEQTEGPAPRQLLFPKGHCDHPDRNSVRVMDGSAYVSKREARFSHAKL